MIHKKKQIDEMDMLKSADPSFIKIEHEIIDYTLPALHFFAPLQFYLEGDQ